MRERWKAVWFCTAITFGGLGFVWVSMTIFPPRPERSGVPVAPGVVRYYEPATARHIYICDKPCAVVQGERAAR